jgi:hypothetical protein
MIEFLSATWFIEAVATIVAGVVVVTMVYIFVERFMDK